MRCFFILFLFAPLLSFGQIKTFKASVYFKSNKSELQKEGKQVLDAMLDTIPFNTIFKVTVSGNTDNIADSLYNMKLSEKRAQTIKNYLVSKGVNEQVIATRYFGKEKPIANNENETGKQKNRRVDIIISCRIDMIPHKVLPEKKIKEVETSAMVDSCKKDTIITLPQGTQAIFNRCEYLELKDCLEIIEMNTPQDILNNQLSLMTTEGEPLASCGMIRIQLNPGCTDRVCFLTPVRINFPVPTNRGCDYCGRNAQIWDVNSSGQWSLASVRNRRIRNITINGAKFYQFRLDCPNMTKNCDCMVEGRKRKFKTKHNYRIETLKILFDCPTAVYELHPEKRKNVVKTKIPCWQGDKTILATIITNKGDPLTLPQQPLNDLPKRRAFSGCHRKDMIKKIWGIFPVYSRDMYRKYIIKPELLVK